MNKMLFFVVCLVLTNCNITNAQSWQWGKSGGSPVAADGYGPWEDLNDITVDKWGNVYAVSNVFNQDLYIAGIPYPAYGFPNTSEICITSFKCDGTLRWYKMIIGSDDDEGFAIKTDTLGGVYVTGRIIVFPYVGGPDSGYIRNATTIDTVIPRLSIDKTMFLAKFDTGGAYKWLRMPEPDTLTYTSEESGSLDMDVDEDGNSYVLCLLKPGVYADGAFVATDTAGWNVWDDDGGYILKYNSSGIFQSGIHLPIRVSSRGAGTELYMKRDNRRHRYYLSGSIDFSIISTDSLFINDTFIANTFVACFDDAGRLIWVKHDANDGHYGETYTRVALDNSGNIYVAGGCQSGFTFNGSTFTSLFGIASSLPYLVKLDTNGNNVWATNGSNGDLAGASGVAVYADTVAVFGLYSTNKLLWGADSIGMATFIGYRSFIGRFNASTGAVIALDTILADVGSNCVPGNGGGFQTGTTGTLAADPFGNFYAGGNFGSQIFMPGDTLVSLGGDSDWFIAKFGTTDCSVSAVPPLAIKNYVPVTPELVKVYPNPVTNELVIENAASGNIIRLFNIMGQQVYCGTVSGNNQVISIGNLVPATYLLQLTDANGNRLNKTIVKQ